MPCPQNAPGEVSDVDTRTSAAPGDELCLIPLSIYERVEHGLGRFFQPISGVAPAVAALDMLDARKAVRHFEVMSRYVDPRGKHVLDLGSGYGTNLIVWTRRFGLDVTGVEP